MLTLYGWGKGFVNAASRPAAGLSVTMPAVGQYFLYK